VWDFTRDARRYNALLPIVAHPPCRLWGNLAHFAKSPDPEAERGLALDAVKQVRRCGGVLEHPKNSRLWSTLGLPRVGEKADDFGGFTILVDQYHWGHRANKETWLYICGLQDQLPDMPFREGQGTHYIKRHNKTTSRNATKLRLPTWEREATPKSFALWLISVAAKCVPPNHENSK
jgi:hypothetical protein